MIHFDRPPLRDVLQILLRGLKIETLPKPRAQKDDAEKFSRTRSLAEVCSPSHLVKFMVDALDEEMPAQLYVDARWLEAACGEAPFITNRYDAESGEEIPFERRAGILDKKLRAMPADADKLLWAKRAVQSVYGFEIQPDSLLLARANVLLTFAEFAEDFSPEDLTEVAEVIAENFWLMDALNLPPKQISLFDEATDWLTGEKIFLGGSDMKFTFVISNPPYQDDTSGDNKTFAPPVYNKFIDAAKKIADKAVFITPARFLFDAGATPKDFNRRMLNDPHFKVLDYAPDAKKYFRGVDIDGGVAVTVYDSTENFGAIGTFTAFEELNAIHKKVCVDNKNFRPLSEIMRGQMTYRLSAKAYEDFPDLPERLPNRTDTALRTNAFKIMPDIFLEDKPDDEHEYLQMLGRIGNERAYRFIRRDYMEAIPEFETYKVFVPKSHGRSNLGDEKAKLISPPVIGEPSVGCTQTFITVGAFDTRAEAEACLRYIKSKFARVMLGILKITQDNPPSTWAKVPLEDFSSGSDIDWRGDIDAQLYRKYNLTDAEKNFVEAHVKEMA